MSFYDRAVSVSDLAPGQVLLMALDPDTKSLHAVSYSDELDYSCAHCGKQLGGTHWDSFNDGVTIRRYHTAKKYAARGVSCRVALAEAKRSLPGEVPS